MLLIPLSFSFLDKRSPSHSPHILASYLNCFRLAETAGLRLVCFPVVSYILHCNISPCALHHFCPVLILEYGTITANHVIALVFEVL